MISIPLSLAIGLVLLEFTGFSLNQLSIAGFVVALGLLVDDSIVVVENIARHLRMGYDRAHAAVAATDQIALAVLGCTATLHVRLPAAAVPAGRPGHVHPLAAGGCALHDRCVARRRAHDHSVPRERAAAARVARERRQRSAAGAHERRSDASTVLRCSAPSRGRAPRLLAGLAVFVGSLGLVPLIGFSLFPSADTPQFLIEIETAEGASLAETDRALRFVEEELAKTGGGQALVREPRSRQSTHLLQRDAARDARQCRRGVRGAQGIRPAHEPCAARSNCVRCSTSIPRRASP